jgi:adenosylhomocysteine nucleosidase
MASSESPIAILSALSHEQDGLVAQLQGGQRVLHAGREFWSGRLQGQSVVLALSRIGKVAAATTAAALIERFAVRAIVFTGVAGGVGPGVRVGDLVVGAGYVQHDMDASPLFPRYQVPLTHKTVFPADLVLLEAMQQACEQAMALREYNQQRVLVHQGLIASGDRFVNHSDEVAVLLQGMLAQGLQPLAVEMEGAAVAQTCADYGVPFVAVRTISDRADGSAHVEFLQFVQTVASQYACDIVLQLLAHTSLKSIPARAVLSL